MDGIINSMDMGFGGLREFPSPLLIATGEEIPLRGLEGVPGLPGAPQDEAGLTRKFET